MKRTFEIDNRSYDLEIAEGTEASLSLLRKEGDVTFLSLHLDFGAPVNPSKVTLSYDIPCKDTYTIWDPLTKQRHLFGSWVNERITESRIAFGMPIKAMVSKRGLNTYLISVSDVKTPISIKLGGHPLNAVIKAEIDFFTLLTGPFTTYDAIIRIDESYIPLCNALYSAREWFESLGYSNDHIPTSATLPMYSTWYSYGQKLFARDILKECKSAVQYGMKTVIIDDGWQLEGEGRGYGYCGDWKPSRRFGNMKKLVESIHALGMKVMVWFSVPFIGHFARCFSDFEGKYLHSLPSANCSVLDPRYREVRDWLVSTYVSAVKEWNLDGLKLDFIDRFKTNGTVNDDMDYTSVEDAVEALLSEIRTALREINPDIMIEFRQPYYGPVISTYGNMMRVWDCPLDGATNKNQTINLRLCYSKCATHSDMIYWHSEDSNEGVATQLIGTIFSVPQISTRMNSLIPEHKKVLKHYLSVWCENRDIIMNGSFYASPCESTYSFAYAEKDSKRISLAMTSQTVSISDNIISDRIFNITESDFITVRNEGKLPLYAKVIDCTGKCISRKKRIRTALTEIFVPVSASLELTRE